jgi:hypothetical protein
LFEARASATLRASVSARATIALAATTALLVALGGVLASRGAAVAAMSIPVAAAFVPYAFFLAFEPRGPRWLPFALAGLASLALVIAPPLLSDDAWRFVWDARVLSHGIDPYRYAPDDPALFALRDAAWTRINHPEIPTIYPPLSQGLFFVANAIAHHPISIKILASAVHLGCAWLLSRSLGARAAYLYALNPLALVESGLSGHLDAIVGAALLAAVLSLDRRPWLAASGVAIAIASKLVGLLALPVLLRAKSARWRALALAVAALASTAPLAFAGYGSDAASGLANYSRRWRGNESAFAVLERGSKTVLGWFPAEGSDDHVRADALRPIFESVAGTPLDPRASLVAPKKEIPDLADFPIDVAAGLVARVLAALAVIAIAIAAARRCEPSTALRWTVLAALLLAPQVHPWYLLWLLPLEIAAGRVTGLLWSAVVLVSYIPLDRWLVAREWAEPELARAFEYAIVYGALALEIVRDGATGRGVLWMSMRPPAGRSQPGGA